MEKKIRQLQLAEMEHGLYKTYAVIGLTPEQLTELKGIQFEAVCDEFDNLLGALLLTKSGRQFSLRHYIRNPNKGQTELIGSETSPDEKLDLTDFLETLEMPGQFILWTMVC